jgi:hypothetical protein
MHRIEKIIATVLLASVLGIFDATPTLAHHSHASLNPDDVRLFQGIVTRYSWRAPHVYIRANVFKADGGVQEYLIEALNPPAMSALGWSRDSFKEGDLITWEGPHDLDVERGYAGMSWADTPDGTRLFAGASDYRQAQKAQSERLAQVEIFPVLEIGSGNWARVSADGSPFPPIRAPRGDWPLTEAAAARTATWSEDDNPINNCVYGGPPRSIFSLSNFQWTRPDDKTLVIDRDMWTQARVIHLDASAPSGAPSGYGHSVGRFTGDELVIESDNFIDEGWGMFTGIDSTAQKKLKERYWLSHEGLRLNVELTVEDPGTLTEPFTTTHQWKRVPDRPLIKAECSVETALLYKTAGYSAVADDENASLAGAEPGAMADSTLDENKNPPYAMILLIAALAGFAVWRVSVRR